MAQETECRAGYLYAPILSLESFKCHRNICWGFTWLGEIRRTFWRKEQERCASSEEQEGSENKAGEGGVVWKSVWEAGLGGVGTPMSGHLIGIFGI